MPKRKNLAKNQLAVVKRVVPGAEEERQKLAAINNMRLGVSMADAARNAGVSRSTLYRWIASEPEFQAVYNSWHEETKECTRASLVAMYDVAVDNVRRGIERGDVGLSMKVLKAAGALEPEGRRMTDVEEIKRRAELDEKKRRMDMEEEEVRMHSDLDAAKVVARSFEDKDDGKKKGARPGEDGKVVAKIVDSGGKIKRVLTKTTMSPEFSMSQRPTNELIGMYKKLRAEREDGARG